MGLCIAKINVHLFIRKALKFQQQTSQENYRFFFFFGMMTLFTIHLLDGSLALPFGGPYPKDAALGIFSLSSLTPGNSAHQMTRSISQMQTNQG